MTYDNLFKDRATWGRSYGCILDFVDPAGNSLDMTGVSAPQVDFKQDYGDPSALFSLTLGDGLSWLDNDITTGSLKVYISPSRMGMVIFSDGDDVLGFEVPDAQLYGDLKITGAGSVDLIYDEATVPKIFLSVEKRITGA